MALDIIPKQEDGKLKAVASGTLPSGVPVVVNSDGTVSVIGSSGSNLTPSPIPSSVATFNAGGTTQNIRVASDPNNSGKFVVVYKDLANSGYGTAAVGTVSGTSISFGSEVIFKSGEIAGVGLSFDPNTSSKLVVTYQANDAPYYCSVKVGTISGTSISFGSEYTVSDSNLPLVAFDPNSANKFVFAYCDPSYVGKALIGTVSGTSISFGSASTYETGPVYQNTIAADPNNAGKFIIAYQDSGNSSYGTCVVGTISGTSISFGTASVFYSGNLSSFSSAFDPNNSGKFVVSYRNYANSQYGTAIVGTVSGSSATFGSPVVFNAGQTEVTSVSFDENNSNVFAIGYEDVADSYYGKVVFGTISGTSVSFSSEVIFNEARTDFLAVAFDPNQTSSLFIAYRDGGDGQNGKAILSTASNLTSENYIGMSGGAIEVDSQTEELGSAVVFESADTTEHSVVFDSANNKVVIAYEDRGNLNYGTAVVGTVSGTSISFGTPVVFESAESRNISATFDSSNNKVVIAYDDNGNSSYGTAVVGTVSGTSISFGSPVVFESAGVANIGATFDSSNNKVVIAYEDNGNSNYGTAIVGTVSGTSISFGSAAVFESAQTARVSSAFDSSNNKVVVAYRTTTGKAAVGTVSGTSISFGTPVEFYNATTEIIDIVFDSNVNKVVIAYQSSANDAGLAKVGTVSGTSISFGAEATFNDSNVSAISPVFDSSIKKVVIAYEDKGNSDYGTYVVGTVSDTSISFGTSSVFDSVNIAASMGATFDSANNKVVTAYRDGDNSNYGTSVVLQAGYTNITRGEVADGDNATVDIVGTVSTNQLSLTAGQQYYVQTDGTIGTTPANPSVLAGTAVSATKLLVKT